MKYQIFFNFFHFLTFLCTYIIFFLDLNSGEKLFSKNCVACHQNGTNIIIPEKNLKKSMLKANGMDNPESIIYQITNGKNGMPAFGGRLKENEIKAISFYILNDPFLKEKEPEPE